MASNMMNAMSGIDVMSCPFRANNREIPLSQGVALGFHVMALRARMYKLQL